MTHFEYIAVAVALLYSIAVARLLSGMAPSLDAPRRYWVQICWIFQILVVVMSGWWGFWNARDVQWTSIGFVSSLGLPALQYVRAITIVGDDRTSIDSFREHFYQQRIRFFGVSLLTNVVLILNLWIIGRFP